MSIEIKGLKEIREIFTSIKKLRYVRAALKTAASHIKYALQKYPTHSPRKMKFVSERQRKYFFWAVNKGQITLPYRRGSSPTSRNLKQMWTVDIEKDGMTAIIGNNTPYGPLVQGEGTQTRYHMYTGWKTTAQVENEERETVMNYLGAALAADV